MPATALPVRSAIAHGIGACAIIAVVAVLSTVVPIDESTTALAAVGAIGGLAWGGAALVERRRRPRRAANDNHPCDPLVPTWVPIANDDPTARALRR